MRPQHPARAGGVVVAALVALSVLDNFLVDFLWFIRLLSPDVRDDRWRADSDLRRRMGVRLAAILVSALAAID